MEKTGRVLKSSLFGVIAISLLIGCGEAEKVEKLPILGRFEIVEQDGVQDTLYHTIDDFNFVNQLRDTVNLDTFKDKIYIADFFFTSCPDICPVMKAEMSRVYDVYSDEENIRFLSHTIDPVHDSVEVLLKFANDLGVDHEKWHFVTGDKTEIYKQSQVSYMAAIADDPNTGLTHSGRFFLIDKSRRIRGAFDGTDPVEVNDLIKKIEILLNEYAK